MQSFNLDDLIDPRLFEIETSDGVPEDDHFTSGSASQRVGIDPGKELDKYFEDDEYVMNPLVSSEHWVSQPCLYSIIALTCFQDFR